MLKRLAARKPPAPDQGSAGFALIATIWALGLMTLLGTAIIVGARYRMVDSSMTSAAVRAALAAEGAVNLAAATLLQQPENLQTAVARFPLRCTMPGAEEAYITIEDEAGKIDLNAARPQLMAMLFAQLGANATDAARIADRIAQFRQGVRRSVQSQPAGGSQPSQAPVGLGNFTSALQLDQVADIPPPLFRAALPFITVRSGQAEPSVDAASPQLRRLLNLSPARSAPTTNAPRRLVFTIRADVTTADGARFIREAVASFGGERAFEIHEWRRGDIDRANQRPQRPTSAVTACIQR